MDFTVDFPEDFTWRDGERITRFGAGAVAEARDFLRGSGWERYELLSTPRALQAARVDLPEDADAVHEVGPGAVDKIAGELIHEVHTPTLVALGGGRVIDTAKAIAAVRGGRVCAIPTTLSGAELTGIHRLPEGHPAPHLVRPMLVCADPDVMTSLPEPQLRASAMNGLAHGADSLYTPLANPVSRTTALRGAELIASALDGAPGQADRSTLALGSLLCAHAIDSALFALHHVVCQSLVRAMGLPHAETNAAMLPRVMEAMQPRAPEAIEALATALGTTPAEIGPRIEALAGGRRGLAELGAAEVHLDHTLSLILGRPELNMTPDPPDRGELRALIESAW